MSLLPLSNLKRLESPESRESWATELTECEFSIGEAFCNVCFKCDELSLVILEQISKLLLTVIKWAFFLYSSHLMALCLPEF